MESNDRAPHDEALSVCSDPMLLAFRWWCEPVLAVFSVWCDPVCDPMCDPMLPVDSLRVASESTSLAAAAISEATAACERQVPSVFASIDRPGCAHMGRLTSL